MSRRVSVKVFFAWYDIWIGAYWDRMLRTLYICPVPMVVLRVRFRPKGHDDFVKDLSWADD